MDILLTRPDYYTEYFLDGATEYGEITVTTATTLRLYGDVDQLHALITAQREQRGYRARFELCRHLTALAAGILQRLPGPRRSALVSMGWLGLQRSVSELAECMGDWAIEDETRGGALKSFRKTWRCDREYRPTKKVARKLNSPGWIHRYVKNNNSAIELRRTAEEYREMCRGATFADREPVEAIIADLNRQMAHTEPQELQVAASEGVSRPLSQKDRKVAKRAAVMAAAVLGATTVGAFAQGLPVTIPGNDIALQITKHGSLVRPGHGQLGVTVLDTENRRLADLCVYLDKTPALDQLTGFALHMQAGLEKEVLSAANLIRVTEDGLNHPAFEGRATARAASPILGRYELQRIRSREYYAATKHMWVSEAREFILGRRFIATMEPA